MGLVLPRDRASAGHNFRSVMAGVALLRTSEKFMRLFQHDETGRMCWSGPTLNREYFTEVPTMYEDELPEPMSDEDYSRWFVNSKVVDGVRVGPRVTGNGSVTRE